jgi:hypothetical protein
MMAVKMREWYPDHNIINVMANTSKERTESLEFMDRCDKHFGLDLKWVEAEINQEAGVGTSYKLCKYEDLKTNGEIFEDGIKKYGIASVANKWCNREMKTVPMKKFADDIFGSNNYSIAIGIRIDEIDRVSNSYDSNNIFYPLIEHDIDHRARNRFWADSPIRITIPAFKGNCDFCFEKSRRKLLTIIREDGEIVSNWWDEMENLYSHIPIDGKDVYNGLACNGGHFFGRGNTPVADLIQMAKKPFRKATDEYIYENELFDFESDCGVNCSIF